MPTRAAPCLGRREPARAYRATSRRSRTAGAVALALTLAVLTAAASAQTHTATIEHDGVRYGRVVYERSRANDIVQTRETARLYLRTIKARESRDYEQRSSETGDGRPLTQSRRIAAGPLLIEADARVEGDRIVLRRREGQQVRTLDLPLPPDLLVDAGLQRRVAAQPAGMPWQFSYSELDLLGARVVAVQLSSDGVAVGDRLALLQETRSGDATTQRRLYWSMSQQRLLPAWSLAGARFESHACAEPCLDDDTQHYELLAGLTVASPYHLPMATRRKTLRYVFEAVDGTAPSLPPTGEQQVVHRGTRSIVTICSDCGLEAPPDPATLTYYRAANAWVQSDHAQLRSLARSSGSHGTVRARMHRLVRFVQRYMTGNRQSLGYASALQAADTRSGDCTEFAVLLAALARAQGIPTRVVGGLLYSSRFTDRRDVFSPHAWVQAWDGKRWTSYDAGVGEFDSTHIVLAIGDGDPAGYADLLRRVRGLRLVAAAQIGNRE